MRTWKSMNYMVAGAFACAAILGTAAKADTLGTVQSIGNVTINAGGQLIGGYEDSVGTLGNTGSNGGSDYDYNDLIFTLTVPGGDSLQVNTTGAWYSAPTLNGGDGSVLNAAANTGSKPFWNHTSYDPNPATANVGYCVYVGNCSNTTHAPIGNGGTEYLASNTSSQTSIDASFTLTGNNGLGASIVLSIAGDTNKLGWQNVNGSGGLTGSPTWCTSNGALSGTALTTCTINLTSGSSFVLIANNGSSTYASIAADGASDPSTANANHFAFFETPQATPEPGSLLMLGSGLLALGGFARRKLSL